MSWDLDYPDDYECCASGSCEVCRGGQGIARMVAKAATPYRRGEVDVSYYLVHIEEADPGSMRGFHGPFPSREAAHEWISHYLTPSYGVSYSESYVTELTDPSTVAFRWRPVGPDETEKPR